MYALKILQEGVKLGSAKCAHSLSSEFRGFDLSDGTNLAGYVDTARAQRYGILARALDFYGGRLKLPNLDKVLPLPPASLPKWDGDKHTLINAAKAVTPPPAPPPPPREGRENIPEGHGVFSRAESPYAVLASSPQKPTGCTQLTPSAAPAYKVSSTPRSIAII